MGAPLDLAALAATRRAISDAIRPRITQAPPQDNPLHPRPGQWRAAAAPLPVASSSGKASAAVAAPSSAAPAAPAKPKGQPPRSYERAAGVEAQDNGVIRIDMTPRGGRASSEQQKIIADNAEAILADALKAAPGAAIDVAYRNRVVASTDESRIVSVAPSRPAAGVSAKEPPAAPAKAASAKHRPV